jgi:hypothetical protein
VTEDLPDVELSERDHEELGHRGIDVDVAGQ